MNQLGDSVDVNAQKLGCAKNVHGTHVETDLIDVIVVR